MHSILISAFLIISVLGQSPETTELPALAFDLSFEVNEELLNHYDITHLRTKLTDRQKIDGLLDLIFGPEKQDFEYAPGVTLPPIQAAQQKQGNCLTFAMLYVTLAREIGLDAKFNTIPFNPSWKKVGDVIVEAGHTNVMIESFHQEFVIEWLEYYKEISKRFIKPMPDNRARSHFYNNLGVAALAKSDLDQAKFHIEKAIEVDPTNSDAWQNYGVYLMIQGEADKAEEAFLKAISKTNKKSSTYLMLSKFYNEQGDKRKAAKYLKIGRRHAKKNPFYLYAQALEAHKKGDLYRAQKLVKKSIAKLPDYPIFYERLAILALERGDEEAWRTNLHIALELTTDEMRKAHYRSRLAMLPPNKNTKNRQSGKDEVLPYLIQ